MFIVGLTGGIATGKSTVRKIFLENGIACIDADEIGRLVMEPGTVGWENIRKCFGSEAFSQDGRVNRAALADIVFNNNDKRKKLNNIVHPLIQRMMFYMVTKEFFSGAKYLVIEVPLLFETGKMLSFMHKVITVTCDDEQQVERLCQRSIGMKRDAAIKRISCQLPQDYKVANSHFVIDNSRNLALTRAQTEDIIRVLNRSRFTLYFRVTLCLGIIGFTYCIYCLKQVIF